MGVRVPSRDELLAIANQKIAEQTAQQISNEYQSSVQLAYEAAAIQKWDDAAYHAREARRLEAEAAPYVAAAQQRPAQQFTPMQQQILERYPGIWNDPVKRAEAIDQHKALMQSGYDPNSERYAQAILVGLGVLDANGQRESNEIASADTAVEAVRNSKYAKDFTREQYDQLAQYRDQLKAAGFYRMDDAP